ncbi:MAG: class I SAM-dependent methyltransferase, partial [Candidatus Edwardsbacteria bacterium]|nr:class I SAM-dependent methyltransferase [Candidatus Edwardsbacteria bacterium]
MLDRGVPVFWNSFDSFKKSEAKFYGREAKSPGLASLCRNFYRPTAYDRELYRMPFDYLKPESLIISLGGGDGRHGLELLRAGHSVLESDLAPDSAAVAGKIFQESKIAGKWAVAAIDAEDIPFAADTFDAVYICGALHQMPNQKAAAESIRRCLKPNGKLILAAEPASWFYKVLRPLAQLLGIRAGQIGQQSVGDEANRGLSYRDIVRFINDCGARPAVIKPKYYLTGALYQATEALYRILPPGRRQNISIRQWETEFLTRLDRIIEYIPIVRKFPFLWIAVA